MNSYDLAEKINFEVNSTITYKTDLDNYETPEFWTLPTKYGDCEDYALLKFHRLVQSGFNPDKIFLVCCYLPDVGGHAVLYVETDLGGFILDNNYQSPMNPNDLPYKWQTILRNKKWYVLHSFA